MIKTRTETKMFGKVAKRVYVIALNPALSTLQITNQENFISSRFNNLRNYREFEQNYCSEVKLCFTEFNLPASFEENDVCLLSSIGRFIDKNSYNFAKKWIDQGVPVYFLRRLSYDFDSRAPKKYKNLSCELRINNNSRFYMPAAQYFMQITDVNDFIVIGDNEDLWALLPCMV